MSGDGVSLQTSLSQLGNVAKTQLKGQQNAQTGATPVQDADKAAVAKVNRVGKTKKSEQDAVDPDGRGREEERRRAAKKKARDAESEETAEETGDDETTDGEAFRSWRIDTRV